MSLRSWFIHQFINETGGCFDWLSFHPYGWTTDVLFAFLQDVQNYHVKKVGKPVELFITEWDFWIQGRQKFDYMMVRNFDAVKHEDVPCALHYRLWQYCEPIYMFGVLWAGWGPQGIVGAQGTPMHDAYDAFWLWRDFRGQPRAGYYGCARRGLAQVAGPPAPGRLQGR